MKIHDCEARERLIVWPRRRMAEFGIPPQAFADSIQHDKDTRWSTATRSATSGTAMAPCQTG
jgi:hypothetical protein